MQEWAFRIFATLRRVRQAWVDESIRFEGEGVYVVAAVVADDHAADIARDAMRSLLLRTERRLHWKHLDVTRRLGVAHVIKQLDVPLSAAVGTPAGRHSQERARRLCLEALLPALAHADVERAWLEARTDRLNRRDREFVDALRAKRMLSADVRVDFRPGPADPMLWIADAVAGAAAAAAGGETGWLKECGDVDVLPVILG